MATARRTPQLAALEAEVAALPESHGSLLVIAADVQDAHSVQHAVNIALSGFGRIDVLVANAGIGQRGAIAEANWDDLAAVLRTNIDGVLHSVQATVPVMRAGGGGHIILISSVMAAMPSPYAAIYAASKTFVSSLANSLRLELEADHIAVTDMLVGQTHTEFAEKRLGRPGRVASKLPTMHAEQVAEAILRAVERRPRQVILRWVDRLIVLGGRFLPRLMGIIARRLYK